MPCHVVSLPGGVTAIVRTSADRRLCETCRKNIHALLCDWPDASHPSGTCSRRLCRPCAVRKGAEDFCPHHLNPEATTAQQRERSSMTTQTSLFPEDPCHGHHKDNPESRAAFETILPHLSRLQELVLGYAHGRAAGITVKQVRRDLGLEHQTASARLTELLTAGLLERTDKRRDRCSILTVTALGERTLHQWRGKSSAAA